MKRLVIILFFILFSSILNAKGQTYILANSQFHLKEPNIFSLQSNSYSLAKPYRFYEIQNLTTNSDKSSGRGLIIGGTFMAIAGVGLVAANIAILNSFGGGGEGSLVLAESGVALVLGGAVMINYGIRKHKKSGRRSRSRS